jgi:DNA-binding CsgD family transcriptional regulator
VSDPRKRDSRPLPSSVQIISLGAYAGLLLFLTDGAAQFSLLLDVPTSTLYVFVSGLCATICCGLVFAIRGALSATAAFRSLGIKSGAAVVLGFTGLLVATSLRLPIIAGIVCAVTFGVGLGALGVGKCLQLSAMQDHRLVRTAALAGIIASLVQALLLVLPSGWLGPGVVVLLLVSSIAPRRIEITKPAAISKDSTILEMTKGMFERNWIFFAGLVISVALGALTWRGSALGDARFMPDLSGQLGTAAGSFLAPLPLLLLSRDKSLKRLRSLTPIIPLFCIAAILLTWVIGVWEEGLNIFIGYGADVSGFFGSLPVGFSITVITILLLRRFAEEARLGLSPVFIIGLFTALIGAFFLVYMALQFVLTWESSRVLDLTLKILYLVAAAIYTIALTQKATRNAALLPSQQIDAARERFALTRRETEILSLLAQGRSAPYIAEAEFIALNTVKTYIKRLYTKVGVHNREELLDIVYSIDKDR